MAYAAASETLSRPSGTVHQALQAHVHNDISEMRERMAAVIAATHDAAMMIISTVENTFETQGPALSPDLQEKLFSVLSACAFQDIAGQHLARMTELLNDIEHCAVKQGAEPLSANEALQRKNETVAARTARMAGGPALAQDGLRQPEVDWLISTAASVPE